MGPREGYADWAATYDERANRTIALEEPAVHGLLAGVPPGRTLDVGCGTGRHTAWLAAAGHDVVGIDPSTEMLARARERLPGVEFREGDVGALPAADGEATLAVCALALSHVPSLDAPLAELARVLAPRGLLVVSNIHPVATAILGWRAWFRRPDGSRAAIPEHPTWPPTTSRVSAPPACASMRAWSRSCPSPRTPTTRRGGSWRACPASWSGPRSGSHRPGTRPGEPEARPVPPGQRSPLNSYVPGLCV